MNASTSSSHRNVRWIIHGLALGGLTLTGLAHAGCPGITTRPDQSSEKPFLSALYVPGFQAGSLRKIGALSDSAAPIVGLWEFQMLSKSTAENQNPMPDGTLIDFGTAAWHVDGTEIMNSGIRNPQDNDVCQGTWEQVAEGMFKLHHVALAWTNGSYTGPTIIEELVKLDASGKHFSGVFTINAYLATETPGHEFDQTTLLAKITGTLTARRITVK